MNDAHPTHTFMKVQQVLTKIDHTLFLQTLEGNVPILLYQVQYLENRISLRNHKIHTLQPFDHLMEL